MIPIPDSGNSEYPEATLASFAQKYRLRSRRDVDGTVVVPGKYGHLYQHADGVLGVMVMPPTRRPRYWGQVRRRLLACGFDVQQDCDAEGTATFSAGSVLQATVAMEAAGVKPIRIKTAAQLESARRGLKAANAAKDRIKTAAKEGLVAVSEGASTTRGASTTASVGD